MLSEKDPRDEALPLFGLDCALMLLESGNDFIPAWAFATLFLRSKGEKLTKQSILDETAIWVGLCQFGKIEFKPLSVEENIPTMAQLPSESEYALKKHFSEMETLISLPGAFDFAQKNYWDEDVKWIKQKIDKASKATSQDESEPPTQQAEVVGDAGKDSQGDTEPDTQKRRDNQIAFICVTAKELKYKDLLNIPEGGKAAIKAECLKNTALFTDAGFSHAWKEANKRKVISMQDKERYL